MALRFKGEFTQKVDTKGRVSIPAAFRRVLEQGDPECASGGLPNFVLVYGDKRRSFIEAYTQTSMAEVDDKIANLPRGSKARRALERMFSGQAQPAQVNETGQVVLSPKIRSKFDLTNEAYFIASGDTFQIWKPEAYDAQVDDLDEYLDAFDEGFDPLELLDQEIGG